MSKQESTSVSVGIFPTDEHVVVIFEQDQYNNHRCVKVYLNDRRHVGSSDLRHLIDLTEDAAVELANAILSKVATVDEVRR